MVNLTKPVCYCLHFVFTLFFKSLESDVRQDSTSTLTWLDISPETDLKTHSTMNWALIANNSARKSSLTTFQNRSCVPPHTVHAKDQVLSRKKRDFPLRKLCRAFWQRFLRKLHFKGSRRHAKVEMVAALCAKCVWNGWTGAVLWMGLEF